MSNITAIIAHKDDKDRLLQKAIPSCKSQTIPINYVVIDDGSLDPPEVPDSTWFKKENEKYTIYESNGNKFIYLKECGGPSQARNIGILESWEYTDFFQILDADDEMFPNKCERFIKEFDDKPIGIVYGDYYIETNGVRKQEFKRPYSYHDLICDCIIHSGSMISKSALLSILNNNEFYDNGLRVCEDYDLFLRISEKFMIKHVPEFLTIVLEHENNSTNSVQKEIWQRCMEKVHMKRLQRENAKH